MSKEERPVFSKESLNRIRRTMSNDERFRVQYMSEFEFATWWILDHKPPHGKEPRFVDGEIFHSDIEAYERCRELNDDD